MTAAVKPPLLVHSGLTGRVYVVTDYVTGEHGSVVASTKVDVTAEFDAIAAERLAQFGPSVPAALSWADRAAANADTVAAWNQASS